MKDQIMENYRLIPFDLSRAKTLENPSGLDVADATGCDVTIVTTNYYSGFRDEEGNNKYQIFAITHQKEGDTPIAYNIDGEPCRSHCPNLWLKEPVKPRRMTQQELSWWLREHPEEHRELSRGFDDGTVFTTFAYNDNQCDDEVPEDYRIRTHGGEWKEPYITEEE